jgi:hypothetical protein
MVVEFLLLMFHLPSALVSSSLKNRSQPSRDRHISQESEDMEPTHTKLPHRGTRPWHSNDDWDMAAAAMSSSGGTATATATTGG